MIAAEPGEVDTFAADLQGTTVRESFFGRGASRVVVAQQQPTRLFVTDASDALAEER